VKIIKNGIMKNVYFKETFKEVQNWNVNIKDICTHAHTMDGEIFCIIAKVLKE
jgi:hypothetical protein